MAPSSGHSLIPKAMNAFKFAISRTASLVRARVAQANNSLAGDATTTIVEAVPARAARQPVHPVALLRQSRSSRARFFSTAARHISRNLSTTFPTAFEGAFKTSLRGLPQSATRTALSKTTCAPFSSTLRPNLVGGALPRSAGGYSLGGAGRRAFSSAPMAQAQVVQNVSAAMRAFCVQGFRPQYDGNDHKTGRARFVAIGTNQDTVSRQLERAVNPSARSKISPAATVVSGERGTTLSFNLVPSVTAFSPVKPASLDDKEGLKQLATDFATARTTLLKIQADLKRLSGLGPLPVSMPDSSHIEVRFRGCDGESVRRLCEELGVLRGIVYEDPGWGSGSIEDKDVGMALLFPCAPGPASEDDVAGYFTRGDKLDWESMMTASSYSGSLPNVRSGGHQGSALGVNDVEEISNLGSESHISFEEFVGSDAGSCATSDLMQTRGAREAVWSDMATPRGGAGYEGVEGIHRFLREIEGVTL